MSFLALLTALALSYYRPHLKSDLLQHLFFPYAKWLDHNFNGGKKRHGVVAWLLGAFIPSLLVGIAYYALLEFNVLLGLLFSTVIH